MKKIYYLSTCDTCKRILKELNLPDSFVKHEIKSKPLTLTNVEELYQFTNSYEALINKRARLFQQDELKNKTLTEDDYKELLLQHYTFLKRPVLLNESQIFIGNSKKVVAAAAESVK